MNSSAPPVLTDTSRAGMLHAIQVDLRSAWASFGAGPECELLETPQITRLSTGLPFAIYNIVPFFSATGPGAGALIAETLDYYRAKGIPCAWWLGPWTQPADMDTRLRHLGPSRTSATPAMAMDLKDLPEQETGSEQVAIKEVTDGPTLREYVDLDLRVFGFATTANPAPVERMVEIDEACGYGPGHHWRHFSAWVNGRPVSNTSLFLGGGAAGLYGVATLPEARHQGIATAVVLHALRAARLMGYRIATLQASDMGAPLYSRIGFREYCRINIYEWDFNTAS